MLYSNNRGSFQAIHLLIILIFAIGPSCHTSFYSYNKIHIEDKNPDKEVFEKYKNCKLEKVLPYNIFRMAMIGYHSVVHNCKMPHNNKLSVKRHFKKTSCLSCQNGPALVPRM